MKIYKKIIRISILIMLISLVIAIGLEWRIDDKILNNKINILAEHRSFVINILIGIFTGGILSFLTSIASFFTIERNTMLKYFDIASEIYVSCDILLRNINKNINESRLEEAFLLSDKFMQKLTCLEKQLNELINISLQFTIVHISVIFNPFFRKKRELLAQIKCHMDYAYELADKVVMVRRQIMLLENSSEDEKGRKDVNNDFQKKFKELLKLLGEEDDTIYSAMLHLMEKHKEYFKL